MGYKQKFTIDGRLRHKTVLGGFISIVFFILFILGFLSFGQDLLYKLNPIITVSSFYDENPNPSSLSQSVFGVYISLQDHVGNSFYDPAIANVDFILQNITTTVNPDGSSGMKFDEINLKLELCNLRRHFPYMIDVFAHQDLNNLLCINPDDQNKLTLVGQWGSPLFSTAKFAISQCNNKTSNVICKPQDVIDAMLNGGYFGIDFTGTIFDHSNFAEPNRTIRHDYYTTMSNKYFKEYNFYIGNIDYTSYDGLVFNSPNKKNFLIFMILLSYLTLEKQLISLIVY